MPMFIAMDPPQHTAQRRTVAPAFGPSETERMRTDTLKRTSDVLDSLPVGEPFDWVEKLSIELTTQMLAILFDFPWEERHKLTAWSRSEEHTSELQSLMRISYAVFCLKKKIYNNSYTIPH